MGRGKQPLRVVRDELGLDFSVIYPIWGLMVGNVGDEEIRRAACRAMNVYSAEVFAPYADRMTPVAAICFIQSLNGPNAPITRAPKPS